MLLIALRSDIADHETEASSAEIFCGQVKNSETDTNMRVSQKLLFQSMNAVNGTYFRSQKLLPLK
jgi:hypothetical protein